MVARQVIRTESASDVLGQRFSRSRFHDEVEAQHPQRQPQKPATSDAETQQRGAGYHPCSTLPSNSRLDAPSHLEKVEGFGSVLLFHPFLSEV